MRDVKMNMESQLLVTSALVEVQDFRKKIIHFRGIRGLYLKLMKEKPKNHNMQPVGLGNTTLNMIFSVIMVTFWMTLSYE
jgi:hypothetical protein